MFWSPGGHSRLGQTKKNEEYNEITDFMSPQAFKIFMILHTESFVYVAPDAHVTLCQTNRFTDVTISYFFREY